MVDFYICGTDLKTIVYRYSSDPSDNGARDFTMFGDDFDNLDEAYKIGYQEEYQIITDYHKSNTRK